LSSQLTISLPHPSSCGTKILASCQFIPELPPPAVGCANSIGDRKQPVTPFFLLFLI